MAADYWLLWRSCAYLDCGSFSTTMHTKTGRSTTIGKSSASSLRKLALSRRLSESAIALHSLQIFLIWLCRYMVLGGMIFSHTFSVATGLFESGSEKTVSIYESASVYKNYYVDSFFALLLVARQRPR